MIETWSEIQRPDYEAVLAARREAEERTRLRHQREQEALEWERQQKAEAEREELWSWYENDYDVAESFAARDRAQESQRSQELREEIGVQVLITEIDREVEQTPKK